MHPQTKFRCIFLLALCNRETDIHDTSLIIESLSSLRAVKELSFYYLVMHRPSNYLMLEYFFYPIAFIKRGTIEVFDQQL